MIRGLGRADGGQGHAREENVIAIIAIGWLLAIWAVVILFSIYFSQNMK